MKRWWLKGECQKFYDTCEWEKVAFVTFYWRVKVHPDIAWDVSIRPEKRKTEPKVHKWKFDTEMNYWLTTKGDKPERHVFYGRLVRWYTKEQAILVWEKWDSVKREKPRATCSKPYTYKYTKKEQSTEEEDYTWIDITYPKEVARVFRKEFYNVIDSLEDSIRLATDKDDIRVLNDKLEFVKAELNLFNLYNQ